MTYTYAGVLKYTMPVDYYITHLRPVKLLTLSHGRKALREYLAVAPWKHGQRVLRALAREAGKKLGWFDKLDNMDYWDDGMGHLWSRVPKVCSLTVEKIQATSRLK